MSDDSKFLNSLNGSTNRYSHAQVYCNAQRFQEISKAWANVGINSHLNPAGIGDNRYYLNGQQITQEQARQHAMKVTGHYMTESDWKW